MTDERWCLAIVSAGPVTRGGISEYGSATEAAAGATAVLQVVADCLRAWGSLVGRGDDRAVRARQVADRLLSEAAAINNADTEEDYAANLDDPNLASIPLNTVALPADRAESADRDDPPLPIARTWGERPVWLQIWTTRSPRPVADRRAAPLTERTLHAPQSISRSMNVVDPLLGGRSDPLTGSPESVRRWVTDTITAGVVHGCGACRPGGPCPSHAADAVVNACRHERLFIMPAADADAIVEAAVRSRQADPIRGDLRM